MCVCILILVCIVSEYWNNKVDKQKQSICSLNRKFKLT